MKRNITTLLILLGILLFVTNVLAQSKVMDIINKSREEAARRVAERWEMYEDPDLLFSVEKPRDWFITLVDSEYIFIQSPQKD